MLEVCPAFRTPAASARPQRVLFTTTVIKMGAVLGGRLTASLQLDESRVGSGTAQVGVTELCKLHNIVEVATHNRV